MPMCRSTFNFNFSRPTSGYKLNHTEKQPQTEGMVLKHNREIGDHGEVCCTWATPSRRLKVKEELFGSCPVLTPPSPGVQEDPKGVG